MSFSSFDFMIIITSLIFIILLSFVGPAVGMGGDSVNSTDVPEFNLTQTRFDFVQDLPEYPSEPSSGVLNHSSDRFDNFRGNIQVELGAGDNGNRIFLVAINETTVHLTDVEDSTINDSVTFTANDQTKDLNAYGYDISVHSVDISAGAGEYEWVATERPDDSSLPLIGGALDLADAVAAGLAWIGSTLVIGVLIIVEGFANVGGLIYDGVTFALALLHFIITNYTGIISGSPSGFASVIVSIPGVIFAMQIARMGLRFIRYVPFIG